MGVVHEDENSWLLVKSRKDPIDVPGVSHSIGMRVCAPLLAGPGPERARLGP
ncbi:hypothetical protein Syun_020981 [Stephania yunnanensis]|uniref:Uncharacterized protein n=1 Tax=Stephania yunnanensis TaxID=152371 RepID=A0AAP0IEV3_9MAGN